MKKTRLFSLLAAVWMAVAGAVAQTETLLTTITATAAEQASYSTEGVATVSFSGSSSYYANWGWWGYGWTATVTPDDGYTITKCVFYANTGDALTDDSAPFTAETTSDDKIPVVNGTQFNNKAKGITKIEVYGYATPAADPVAIASVTHTPEEAEGTVAITYGTDGKTLTPGTTLLSDVEGQKVTVAVTPQAGYRVVGVTLENVAPAADEPAPDMTATPLTLLVTKAGDLKFYDYHDAVNNLKYTVNGGAAQSASAGGTISGLKVGDVVAFYCNGKQSNMGNDDIFAESNTTIEAQVYGNVMSLLDGANFATATAVGEQAFLYLFYQDAFLSNHPTYDLVLPATTLANGCYAYMFSGCTGLTRTPKLPATTLAGYCYYYMFSGCTSLTDAYVAAPYTTSNDEMTYMFNGITADQLTLHTTADGKAAWEGSPFSFKAVVADYDSEATTGGESADAISAASADGTTGTYTDGNGVEREGIVVTLGDKKYAIATANETAGTPTWTVGGVAYYNFDDAKSQFANNTDSYSAANVWRLSTKDELDALVDLTNSWQADPAGRTWTIGSASLFLPAAGFCRDGDAKSVGVDGGYWSSTPNGENYASVLGVSSGYCIVTDGDPTRGFTVRLICQLP